MDGIDINNLSRIYDVKDLTVGALKNVNLFIKRGSLSVIVGKSGCGKTTLLRLIAGLEAPSDGSISFHKNGLILSNEKIKIGMVFQEPRLMPWLTVAQNVAFGVRDNYLDEAQKQTKVNKILSTVGLIDFKDAYPSQISGGMAQRVALGRTLAFEPHIILMDEPFGALDYFTRKTLQKEIIKIHETMGNTFLFVTHDVEEALFIGEEILVMREGNVVDRIDLSLSYPRDLQCDFLKPIRDEILESISI